MPIEVIAYVGAAIMVVLAILAYRYWRSTATYARQVREAHAKRAIESYRVTTQESATRPEESPVDPEPEAAKSAEPAPDAGPEDAETPADNVEPEPAVSEDTPTEEPDGNEPDESPTEPAHPAAEETVPGLRLIDELEPKRPTAIADSERPLNELLQEVDAEISTLPSSVELINLPVIDRRRVADRRQELLDKRAQLLERRRGSHRKKRERRRTSNDG